MREGLRFVAVPLLGLCALAGAAWGLFAITTEAWFAQDLRLRSALALNGARPALQAELARNNPAGLQAVLEALVRDERLLAARLCHAERGALAATAGPPIDLDCRTLLTRALPALAGGGLWQERMQAGEQPFLVDLLPLDAAAPAAASLLLVHDLGYLTQRRQEAALRLLPVLAAALALVALYSLLLPHWLRRRWTTALGRAFRGERLPAPLAALAVELRQLLARDAPTLTDDPDRGPWTPDRLREGLRRHFQGERLVVLANRAPYIHEREQDGQLRVVHPASGLVSALEPVLRACSGVWVAQGSGSADRETADARGRLRVPPGEGSYWLRRVWLTEAQVRGYYEGFANEGLWPLCHLAHTRPVFRNEDWQHYREVNRKFVDAVLSEVDRDDPVILVQDYHFALAPRLLRERLPRAVILSFWHIPWPSPEQLAICPWHAELVEGLLGSSILGFHTQGHCNNFLAAADRFLECRVDREQFEVLRRGRPTQVRPYPISVEWPHHAAERAPAVADCRAQVRAELGLPADLALGLGIDRLDYTKGLEERLRAVERLFERHPRLRGRFSFLQLSAPSRTGIARYRQLQAEIEALAQRINTRFGGNGWQPVLLRRQHTAQADVFRYYRAADLCFVSSLHDGMNLVAKEYVAARDDEQGVLLLSQFAGAAGELREALLLNPYDTEACSAALAQALHMPREEQRARMRALRRVVAHHNVYRWAGQMLNDAARLRDRERLAAALQPALPLHAKEHAA